jgi:hypothetical protein
VSVITQHILFFTLFGALSGFAIASILRLSKESCSLLSNRWFLTAYGVGLGALVGANF